MAQFIKNRKKIILATVLVSLLFGALLTVNTVLAQGTGDAPQSNKGLEILGITSKALAAPALAITALALWIIKSILIVILGILTNIMDNVFTWNVTWTPANMSIVQIGWAVVRDMANSLFLLIVLWLAITIIFDMERWGGKKLLFRVIMVALLINFSLVMVTATFGFANAIAKVFYKNFPTKIVNGVPESAISDFIANSIDLETLEKTLTPDEATAMEAQLNAPSQSVTPQNPAANPATPTQGPSFKDTLLASVGIPTARAQTVGLAATGCAIGALFGLVAGCAAGAAVGALLGVVLKWGSTSAENFYYIALRNGLAALFILLVVVAFAAATIGLVIRLVAMILLSITAPAAFIMTILPGGLGKKYWDMWLGALIKWAFFAPLFFFFFYLTLYMLQQYKATGALAGNILANTNSFFGLLIIVIMLMGSVMLSFKMGNGISHGVLGMASKVGLLAAGAATGGALMAGGALLKKTMKPEQAEALALRARKIPFVGRGLERALLRPHAEKQEDVKRRATELGRYSPEQLVKHLEGTTSSLDRAAGAIALAQQKKFDLLGGRQSEFLDHAKRYGAHKEILKTNPHLATQHNVANVNTTLDAKIKIVREMEDKTSISSASYGDKETMHALITTLRGRNELQNIARNRPALYMHMLKYNDSDEGKKALEDAFGKMDAQEAGSGTAIKETIKRYRETTMAPEEVLREPRVVLPPGAGEKTQQEQESREEWRKRNLGRPNT